MQKTDDYWEIENMDGNKQKITVPLINVDMIASTGQLLVKTGLTINQFDIIKINDIEAVAIKAELPTGFPNHNWLLTIRCEQMEQLKELLTYENA